MSEYNDDQKIAQIPEEYKPISMWGYFGYEILFAIPIIGFIILIVKAISAKNVNVKNLARSYFCLYIIGIILFVVMAVYMRFTMVDLLR